MRSLELSPDWVETGDQMKSWDENNTRKKKTKDQLVFSLKIGPQGSTTPGFGFALPVF